MRSAINGRYLLTDVNVHCRRTVTTSEQPEHVVRIETDQQLHAVGSLARHRVLRVLRDGPATVTQGAFEARLHALVD